VARYGKRSGVNLYIASWVCTYTVIVLGALSGVMPLLALLALVSMPLTFRSVRILRRDFEDPVRLAPANFDMIKAHSLTSFGLIAAYSISGLIYGADAFQLLMLLLVLAVVYVPALLAMRKPRKSETS